MSTLRWPVGVAPVLLMNLVACSSEQSPKSSPTDRVVLADSTAVPLELDGASRPVVQVMLNGRGPYRLGVETGSPVTRLTSGVLDSLGLRRSGERDGESLVRLDSLRIGDAVIRDLDVAGGDAVSQLGLDGVLGLDACADLLLTVDYPNARLVLSRDSLPEPDGRDVLQAVRVGPFVGIEVDAAGVKEVGVVDTQGGVGFAVIPEVAKRLRFASPLQVVGRAVVGGTAPVEVRMARLEGNLGLGRYRFSRPRIAVHELPPDIPSHLTIGTRVLRHFAVSIDQRSMAIRLVRADTTDIDDA
jgi:aspartyl protease